MIIQNMMTGLEAKFTDLANTISLIFSFVKYSLQCEYRHLTRQVEIVPCSVRDRAHGVSLLHSCAGERLMYLLILPGIVYIPRSPAGSD